MSAGETARYQQLSISYGDGHALQAATHCLSLACSLRSKTICNSKQEKKTLFKSHLKSPEDQAREINCLNTGDYSHWVCTRIALAAY